MSLIVMICQHRCNYSNTVQGTKVMVHTITMSIATLAVDIIKKVSAQMNSFHYVAAYYTYLN